MKKRIFAASMASVMALSSVSVVAFADETVKVDAQESVTKAELKEYVKSFDSFLKSDIYDYGTTQAEQLQNAIDYAENVAANAKATDEDCTAAYQMLKTVFASLKQYSATELKELIADCTPDYDTENILNADLGDKIWNQDTFEDFELAYDDAKGFVDSEDGRLICDAYVDLKTAHDALKELTSVTKAEFRAVLRDYEAIATKAGSFELWRRGTVSVKPTTGTTTKNLTKAYFVTFEEIVNTVYGTSDDDVVKNNKGELIGNTGTWINIGTESTVKDFVETQYAIFDGIQSSKVTTDEDITAAYKAAKEAVAVFASWKADDTERAAKANIAALVNKYRAKLADDYATTLMSDLQTKIEAITAGALVVYNTGDFSWKAQKDFSINLDKATGLLKVTAADKNAYDDTDYVATPDASVVVKKIGKGQDIMKYIPVFAENMTDPSDAEIELAFKIVEAYDKAEKDKDFATAYGTADAAGDDLADLDENNIVAKPAGSRNEYTLINRYLTYVLADKYPDEEAAKSYTKKDVKQLIDDTYDLCDLTGDSEVFKTEHLAAVEGRKDALEWLTAANATKGYQEGDTVDGATATETYNDLKALYDALNDMLKDYPVSYADIAELIAVVGEGLDDGAYKNADAVKAALAKVAFGLSTLDATGDDNEPFTADREFIAYNRLFVNADNASTAEKALYKDVQALEAALDADEPADFVLGDADGDGVLTPKDAAQVLKAYAQLVTLTDTQKKAADFNKDGNVDAKDALAILKSLAGIKE